MAAPSLLAAAPGSAPAMTGSALQTRAEGVAGVTKPTGGLTNIVLQRSSSWSSVSKTSQLVEKIESVVSSSSSSNNTNNNNGSSQQLMCPDPRSLSRHIVLVVRQGLPASSRPNTFFYFSGGLLKSQRSPAGTYQRLAASCTNVDDATLMAVEACVSTLYTSFLKCPQFLSASFQEALSRVLLAYAQATNPTTGHLENPKALCNIAAVLLMTMGKSHEERVFWTLCSMTADRLFPECRGEITTGSCIELRVLQHLVAKKLPRVAAHLQKLQTDVSPIAGTWFTTLFTSALPLEVVLRIWDSTMLEGSKVMIRVALALIKKYESAILSCMHADMLRKVMESRVRCTTDAQELLDLAFKGIGTLKSSSIHDLRCLACAELAKQPRMAAAMLLRPLSVSSPV